LISRAFTDLAFQRLNPDNSSQGTGHLCLEMA
jgi:hypothetical protein